MAERVREITDSCPKKLPECPCANKRNAERRQVKTFNYNRTNYFGTDFSKKVVREEVKLRIPYTGCDIFGIPELDGVRKERRQYPDHHLHSNVVFGSPRPARRVLMIDSSYRNQKRHFCRHNAKSYLDDYY